MSKNIVFEGWLTKSPPTKRIWRAKWRRRWFALRQTGELPGQYFLDYYADRNCRRLKGTINLDLCEQVDAGLHMERGNGSLDPTRRGSVFTVRTQSRTYHLEAECEADMEKWVAAICRVCGLRATDDSPEAIATYQNSLEPMTVANDQYDCPEGGVYIPISECTTGVRVQDRQRAFTFDTRNIVTSNRTFERVHGRPEYSTTFNTAEFSENDSNLSDEDCKSLSTFPSHVGPPVPPRPPKLFQGPKMQEPTDSNQEVITFQRQAGGSYGPPSLLQVPRTISYGRSPTSPGRHYGTYRFMDDDEDECASIQPHYFNLSSLPPAVDRALKPRHSSHNLGHIHMYGQHSGHCDNDILQYLDLDHVRTTPTTTKVQEGRADIARRKSQVAATSEYKTVDFIKTEAFNITRRDAEASRNIPH